MSTLSATHYARAERLIGPNVSKLVFSTGVAPSWIDGTERFWYLRRSSSGYHFRIVDAESGRNDSAFDHDRLAAALSVATDEVVDATDLPFRTIELRGGSVVFGLAQVRWCCDLSTYELDRDEGYRPLQMDELASPDNRWRAFCRDYNVWIRDCRSGEEFALTFDGEESYSYGTPPDATRVSLEFAADGRKSPPLAIWSKDSSKLLTHRIDERHLSKMPLVQASPPKGDRPRLHEMRYQLPGEESSLAEFGIFEIETRTLTVFKEAPSEIEHASPIIYERTWWADDGATVYYLHLDRGSKNLLLKKVDVATGEVRTLIEESGETFVSTGALHRERNARSLSTGEVIWWSERSGWGHLYLYDKTGSLEGAITQGQWIVREVIHVDEENRVVYFTAGGREPGDPYRRRFYRVGLDGKDLRLLDDQDADHQVSASKSGRYFVDNYGTVSSPPVTVLRDETGKIVTEVERGDVSLLEEGGWTWPERFNAKAADGVTDLWGTIFRPSDFDANRSYPVLDDSYPGPQLIRAWPSLWTPAGSFGVGNAAAIAELGSIVVCIDGRGTPLRSKAFHDACFGKLGDAGSLEDHMAVLTQLAARYKYMDLNRVGIYGHSGGGYASARAILKHPDFYKVAVSSAGNHDQTYYTAVWGERYQGLLDGDNYLEQANPLIASNLKGKLLLIHGELDDNVPPHLTMQLVDALIKANKDFDLLLIPNAGHSLKGFQSYVVRRRWDYFVEHLLGAKPPAGYQIKEFSSDPKRPEKPKGVEPPGGKD